MTLSEYLARPGQTASQLAESIGVYPSTITRCAKGEMTPTLHLMRQIETQTNGMVSLSDFGRDPAHERTAA